MGRAGRPKASSTSDKLVDRRRYDLMEAAYVLVGRKGLEGLRTRDIAAGAGVNAAMLHYYFGTKEALLVALVEHTNSKFAASAAAQTGLRDHFEVTIHTFQHTPYLAAVLQELALRSQRDEATRAAMAVQHDRWNELVATLIRSEIEQGRCRHDVDPRAGARVITSFILGSMVQLAVSPGAFDFRELAALLERWLPKPESAPGASG